MLLILNAKKQINKPIFLILLAVLAAGVFFSTSRSALLAVILTAIIMAYYQPEIKLTFKSVLTVFLITAIVLGGFYFGYAQLRSSETGENTFVDKLHERIFEEPLRVLGGGDGGVCRIFWQPGSGDHVMAISEIDGRSPDVHEKKPSKILFGFGRGNYGEIGGAEYIGGQATQYVSHNGYVPSLIERGFLGLILFILMLMMLSFKMLSLKNGKNIVYQLYILF